MTQIIKTIKGCKNKDVKWDPERKKQIWTYRGRAEKRISSEKLRGELHCAIIRRIRIRKEDRKEGMKAIQDVLAKYDDYW